MKKKVVLGLILFIQLAILIPSIIMAGDDETGNNPKVQEQQVATNQTTPNLEPLLPENIRQAFEKSIAMDAKISEDNPLKSTLERIDYLFHRGSAENYGKTGVDILKEALDLCSKTLEENPNDYEVMWRYSRSAYKYAESVKGIQLEGWKKICGELGRKGMKVAEKAQELEPNRVEAHFWLTCCIGKYVDDSGIITAIKEGFFPKSKKAMIKAYEIDKSYYDYNPVFGMAMINFTPPWPLKNKKKAIKFWEEHGKSVALAWEDYMVYCYGAEFYLSMKGDENYAEARKFLNNVINAPHRRDFYVDWAQKLMKKLDKKSKKK